MRPADMCILPLDALWQQKTRTVLTTLGVVFGTFVLTASLSTNQGVQDTFARELGRVDLLRRIHVWQRPAENQIINKKAEIKGQMSEDRRQRLQDAIPGRRQQLVKRPAGKVVDEAALRSIGALPHVEMVVPMAWQWGVATVGKHKSPAASFGVLLNSDYYSKRMLAGRFFRDANERSAIISELLAYRMGFTDDSAVNQLVGKKLRFETRTVVGMGWAQGRVQSDGRSPSPEQMMAVAALAQQVPELLGKLGLTAQNVPLLGPILGNQTGRPSVLTEDFTIAGVIRLPDKKDNDEGVDPLQQDADIILPWRTAADLHFKWLTAAGQSDNMIAIVDAESNVDAVVSQIKALGFEASAFREGLKRERLMYSLIFRSMTCIAAVALFVAALGIANTMLMSVLERTREIGVMKAIGAGNGHLQLIFLIEGALIGLVGGGIGLLLAWGASIPGDLWVRSMVSRDIKVDLKSAIFVFPPWITFSVMIFAVLVTTLAAVYPARRAARIDPVAALRHE